MMPGPLFWFCIAIAFAGGAVGMFFCARTIYELRRTNREITRIERGRSSNGEGK